MTDPRASTDREPASASIPVATPAAGERRELRRGHLTLFWDLFYRGLRKMGAHAENFYTTVGIFLVVGAVIAVAGTLAFARLGEIVQRGVTQKFDVAVLQWLGARHTPLLTTIMTEVTPL